METLIINVPEDKSSQVKELLKELGVTIQKQNLASALAAEVNKAIKPGKKLTMDEIVEEVNIVRAKRGL